MTDNDVRRVPADALDGDEGHEGWDRQTAEPQVRGVEAIRIVGADPWSWSVVIWAMEFVCEEPLESELREGLAGALRFVPGVAAVAEEDREVWVVGGNPRGEDLVRACASVVDAFADRIRSHIAGL